MLRSTFLVFITGWITWFWIDKPGARQFHMPETTNSMPGNFQTAFDMLKAGYPDMAFVYIWSAHYLVLSLLGGAMLAVVYGAIAGYLDRRRMRRYFLPPPRQEVTATDQGHTDPEPAEQDRAGK